jgi:hypothetical protein
MGWVSLERRGKVERGKKSRREKVGERQRGTKREREGI